jgi:hypothetical protein
MSSANSIRAVHLRRALLLFAIVLGMAALAASLSRPVADRADDRAAQPPAEQQREREPARPAPRPPTAAPTPSSAPRAPLTFAAGADETRRVRAGEAATLEVAVDEPGSVEIPGLGLTATADPLTVARFEVFPSRPGRYEIVFTPAAGDDATPAGELVVTSAG